MSIKQALIELILVVKPALKSSIMQTVSDAQQQGQLKAVIRRSTKSSLTGANIGFSSWLLSTIASYSAPQVVDETVILKGFEQLFHRLDSDFLTQLTQNITDDDIAKLYRASVKLSTQLFLDGDFDALSSLVEQDESIHAFIEKIADLKVKVLSLFQAQAKDIAKTLFPGRLATHKYLVIKFYLGQLLKPSALKKILAAFISQGINELFNAPQGPVLVSEKKLPTQIAIASIDPIKLKEVLARVYVHSCPAIFAQTRVLLDSAKVRQQLIKQGHQLIRPSFFLYPFRLANFLVDQFSLPQKALTGLEALMNEPFFHAAIDTAMGGLDGQELSLLINHSIASAGAQVIQSSHPISPRTQLTLQALTTKMRQNLSTKVIAMFNQPDPVLRQLFPNAPLSRLGIRGCLSLFSSERLIDTLNQSLSEMTDALLSPKLQATGIAIKQFRQCLEHVIKQGYASKENKERLCLALNKLMLVADAHKNSLAALRATYMQAVKTEPATEFVTEMTSRIQLIDELTALSSKKNYYQQLIISGKINHYIRLKNELLTLENALNAFIERQHLIAASPEQQIGRLSKVLLVFIFLLHFGSKAWQECKDEKAQQIKTNAELKESQAIILRQLTTDTAKNLDAPNSSINNAQPMGIRDTFLSQQAKQLQRCSQQVEAMTGHNEQEQVHQPVL